MVDSAENIAVFESDRLNTIDTDSNSHLPQNSDSFIRISPETKEVPTFAEFANNEYLPLAYQTKRSAADDAARLRHHLLPRLGHKRLTEITARDAQLLLAHVLSIRSPATANRCLAQLSHMLRLAVSWEIIPKNPCEGIKKAKEPKSRERFLTPDEIARLFDAMQRDSNPIACAALKFLLLTGVRRREATHARWSQVDLERGLMFLPVTKSGRAHHVILNTEACALLESLPSRGRSEWIFPGKDPRKPLNNPRRCFRRLLKASQIEPMRIHDLRHSFASTAINAGASLPQVQALLAHSSPAMTLRYSHLSEKAIRQASEAVSDVVRKALWAGNSSSKAALADEANEDADIPVLPHEVLDRLSADAFWHPKSQLASKWFLIEKLFGYGWKKSQITVLLMTIDKLMASSRVVGRESPSCLNQEPAQATCHIPNVSVQSPSSRGKAEFLLLLLTERFKDIPDHFISQLACSSEEQLDHWFMRAMTARDLAGLTSSLL